MITVENTTEHGARETAITRRGHLTKFAIVAVEQDYTTRPMTRADEAEIGARQLAAIHAKRAAP